MSRIPSGSTPCEAASSSCSYPLPPNAEDTEILRVVVRESLSGDLVRKLIVDILQVTETLLEGGGPRVQMVQAAKDAREKRESEKHEGVPKKDIQVSHDPEPPLMSMLIFKDNTSTWARPC